MSFVKFKPVNDFDGVLSLGIICLNLVEQECGNGLIEWVL